MIGDIRSVLLYSHLLLLVLYWVASSSAAKFSPVIQAGFDWGDFVDGIASGGAKQRKQDNGEPFYGFTDFLRDLDVDLKRWSDQVDKKGVAN